MPTFERGETSLYYEEHGTGYPVLLFAPGGLRLSIPVFERSPYHPIRELSDAFRLIALDQRNAGRSRAPVHASDGWATYRDDHLALLDHLGVERCHLLGICIGGSFGLGVAQAAPERVTAAVLQQPIGFSGTNRATFHELFEGWAADLVGAGRSDVTRAALDGFRANLFDGDFVYSVTRDDVRRMETPLLVLRGNDVYHPGEISEEIARLAPKAELITSWKEGEDLGRAVKRIRAFLQQHVPAT